MMFSKVGEAAKIQGGNNIDTIIKDGTTAFGKATGDAITVNFSVAGAAENIIGFIDQMIGYVDQRADLGAIQNRLESSIRNQSNVAANEADARSRIRDADLQKSL